MPAAMTGQKGNTYALQRAHGDDVAGLAEGCVDIHLADGGHSLDLVQSRPPDDSDGGGWFRRHRRLLLQNTVAANLGIVHTKSRPHFHGFFT